MIPAMIAIAFTLGLISGTVIVLAWPKRTPHKPGRHARAELSFSDLLTGHHREDWPA